MLPKVARIIEDELRDDGSFYCIVITDSGDSIPYSYNPEKYGALPQGWCRWAYANEPAVYGLPIAEVPAEVLALVSKAVN
jgi:hypothetical protein